MRIISVLAMSVLFTGVLSGCDNEKAQVQLHEPGKYQGKVDTSAVKTDDEAIKKRFAMIQTDR